MSIQIKILNNKTLTRILDVILRIEIQPPYEGLLSSTCGGLQPSAASKGPFGPKGEKNQQTKLQNQNTQIWKNQKTTKQSYIKRSHITNKCQRTYITTTTPQNHSTHRTHRTHTSHRTHRTNKAHKTHIRAGLV